MLQRLRGIKGDSLMAIIITTLIVITLLAIFVFIGSDIADSHTHNQGIIYFMGGILFALNIANLLILTHRSKHNKKASPLQPKRQV